MTLSFTLYLLSAAAVSMALAQSSNTQEFEQFLKNPMAQVPLKDPGVKAALAFTQNIRFDHKKIGEVVYSVIGIKAYKGTNGKGRTVYHLYYDVEIISQDRLKTTLSCEAVVEETRQPKPVITHRLLIDKC